MARANTHCEGKRVLVRIVQAHESRDAFEMH